MRMQKKLYILISFSLALCAGAQTVKVADFGAIPNDGKCDKHAVRMAYQHAKQTKAKELVFDKGTYDFEIDDPTKEAALDLFEFENFCVRGEVNADGSPATLLLRHYKFASNMTGLQILRAIRCKNFSVKNLAFDNSPRYSSAGKVVEIAEDRVVIEVFKGNPAIDGCVFYCGNVWDLKTKYLKKGAPSLTYGDEIAADEDSYKMRVLPKKKQECA